MNSVPESCPVLSYVLYRLTKESSFKNARSELLIDMDEDASDVGSPNSSPDEYVELVERMPRLEEPALLASLTDAVSDVARIRFVLESLGTLGSRPDRETVDAARARLTVLEDDFVRQLDEVNGPVQWPKEREMVFLRAVVKLDHMHECYQKLQREAEERLVRMYEAGVAGHGKEFPKVEEEQETVDEEVVAVLQQAASNQHLETVNLSNHQLKHLPETFGSLRGLLSLNLSHNQLSAIPDAISGLECLEELQLSSNFLTSLPDSLGLLLSLKILNVSTNKLKSLPDGISRCRSLVEFDASYNDLAYLPTNFGHEQQKLETLCIHLNKIRSLPTYFCEMRSLRKLDAHFNELLELPDDFGKLTSLEILDLSSNFTNLRELPASFGDLFNLKELDLSNNQIRMLPDTFGGLYKLIKLNLDQNPLVLPPPDVVADGVEAVKEYMAKRWDDNLPLGERKNPVEETMPSQNTWFSRSTSWINSMVSGVSEVTGYLGTGHGSQKSTYKLIA